MTLAAIRRIVRLVDLKDSGTELHSERVSLKVLSLALAAGWSQGEAVRLSIAGSVHDVGKIGIDAAILGKPGPLTAAEFDIVKLHPVLGEEMMVSYRSFDPEQREWVRHHHERADGRGYPDRIRVGEISDGAALLALADSWDVMVSERPYKRAMSVDDAFEECRRCAGTQFTVPAVRALEALLNLS